MPRPTEDDAVRLGDAVGIRSDISCSDRDDLDRRAILDQSLAQARVSERGRAVSVFDARLGDPVRISGVQ